MARLESSSGLQPKPQKGRPGELPIRGLEQDASSPCTSLSTSATRSSNSAKASRDDGEPKVAAPTLKEAVRGTSALPGQVLLSGVDRTLRCVTGVAVEATGVATLSSSAKNAARFGEDV